MPYEQGRNEKARNEEARRYLMKVAQLGLPDTATYEQGPMQLRLLGFRSRLFHDPIWPWPFTLQELIVTKYSFAILLILIALSSEFSATAADSNPDVIILVTPKCPLDTKPIKLDENLSGGNYPFGQLNPRKRAQFAFGASVKDVKLKGETIVVELLGTEFKVGNSTIYGTRQGDKVASQIPIKVIDANQPYKIWYCKDADAKPEIVAEHVTWFPGNNVFNVSNTEVRIDNLTREELIQRVMPKAFDYLAYFIERSYGTKVFTSKPYYLSDSQMKGVKSLPNEQPYSWPLFKPAKITYGKTGEAVCELVLQNPFPFPVTIALDRIRSDAEDKVLRDLELANRAPPRKDLVFELAAKEKKTVTVTVPSELVTKNKLTSGTYFMLGALLLNPPLK